MHPLHAELRMDAASQKAGQRRERHHGIENIDFIDTIRGGIDLHRTKYMQLPRSRKCMPSF
jgi:hypothetical protein